MPNYKYKIEATSTSALEWMKASLEGIRYKMKNDSSRKKWRSDEKSIIVVGKLDVFVKCKGPKGTEVEVTVTETNPPTKKVLDKKKIVIGDDSNEPKIGHLSIRVNAK